MTELAEVCIPKDVTAQRQEGIDFTDIYRRYYPYVLRVVGGSEDLAQEVFLKVYQGMDSFRPGARVQPWITSIARYTKISSMRNHDPLNGQTAELADIFSSRDPNDNPEYVVGTKETFQTVGHTLNNMPPEYRQPLALKLAELSDGEIAERLGITSNTAKTRIHRGRKRLKLELAKQT